MHEIAVNTAHLLWISRCVPATSLSPYILYRSVFAATSLIPSSSSSKKIVPVNPLQKKSQGTSNIQKLKKDLQVTPEEPTPLSSPLNKSSF